MLRTSSDIFYQLLNDKEVLSGFEKYMDQTS